MGEKSDRAGAVKKLIALGIVLILIAWSAGLVNSGQ